jgi:hypothetical protein
MSGSSDDLLDDIDAWAQQLLELVEAVGDLLRPSVGVGLPSSTSDDDLHAEPTTWSTTVKLFATVTERPLQLATAGFRLVGAGPGTVIGPKAVSFAPAVLQPGQDTFTVTVQRTGVGNGIYEGTITTAKDPGTPITDPVMPAW